MRKRNKKYNPMKEVQTQSTYALKNLTVFYSLADGDTCIVLNTKTFNPVQITRNLATAITNLRHNWRITMLALGRRQDGQEYFKAESVSFSLPMFQSELSEALSDLHKDFVEKEMNKQHLCNVCWFACPRGTEFENEHLDKMLTKLNAYNNKAKWEE